MNFSTPKTDFDHMARAIQLAKRGIYTTTPNPNVGCVIVKDHKVIAEGWHAKAGLGHAEANALAQLPLAQSQGATAYVTLEPCSHYGRTPPCADRLVAAKIKRVVIAMLDPNPKVAGKGIKRLQEAGIEVEVGILEQDARALNLGFLSQMERKRPYVQVKLASSIDGKVALANGESKWITGGEARADVQKHRALSCGILTTANTVIRDNARLNVRENELGFDYPKSQFDEQIRQPVKIILDGSDQIQPAHISELAIFNDTNKLVLVKSSKYKSSEQGTCFNDRNIELVYCEYEQNLGFDLTQVLDVCSTRQVNHLWVEAGGNLAASFVEQNLFDQLILYMAPKILGKNGLEVLPLGPYSSMQNVTDLHLVDTVQVGNDIKFTFHPQH